MARNYEHSNDETNNETIELRIRAVEPCRGNDPDAVMMRISASASSRSKALGRLYRILLIILENHGRHVTAPPDKYR